MNTHSLEVTNGVVDGMTVQFAEGRWPGKIGPGVVMSGEAFDFVEPFVAGACASWTRDHRYGVFELSLANRKALATLLFDVANSHSQHELLVELAKWLEARCGDNRDVSILGY
jgi:hypothetical protein